jgi:hypothetical protein
MERWVGDLPNANKFNLKNPFEAKKKRQSSKLKACIQQPTYKRGWEANGMLGRKNPFSAKKEKAKR